MFAALFLTAQVLAGPPLLDFDPTVDRTHSAPPLIQGGGGQGVQATSGCDLFSRSDNDDLGFLWEEVVGDMQIRSERAQGKTNASSNNSFSQLLNVDADYSTSKVKMFFQTNGGNLRYAAMVAGYKDLDNCVHVKVQDGTDADALFDKVYFRYGNNKSPWNPNKYVFDIETPCSFGTLTLTFRNNGDIARLELENPFSNETEVFECPGLSSKKSQLGTGFGISTYGDVFIDEFDVNDGVCVDGFTLETNGSPGGVMDFVITGGTPSEQVVLIFGTGTGAYNIPFQYACSGTQLQIQNPQDFLPMRADAAGSATLTRNVPSGAAGFVRIQALDVATCEISDAITL